MLADLSHKIVAGMVTYPRLTPPELDTAMPIIEHLTNQGTVPQEGARLIALPAPLRGMASFPVRAVAVSDQ